MDDAVEPADEQVSDRIKVWFKFVPREGWLPYDKEGLWAERLSDDTARLANAPLLQDGVAEGEAVRFLRSSLHNRRVERRVATARTGA